MHDDFQHQALRVGSQMSAASIFKLMVGTLLLLMGVALGLYVANVAFEVIYSETPVPLIERISALAEEKIAAEAANPNVPNIKLPPELLRTVLYGLTFLMLTIPVMIASMLLATGAKLMQGEMNEAITMLAERLKKTS